MPQTERARKRFELAEASAILARTPGALDALLRGLPEPWIRSNEGEKTWSPFDVLGHLIHGERTDWMPRARLILERGDAVAFEPFDRFAQFQASAGKSLDELLDSFRELRGANLRELSGLPIDEAALDRPGRHPALGAVTLRQLLATWVAHDLDHLMQVVRVLGTQYADEVGPWRAYLRVISGKQG